MSWLNAARLDSVSLANGSVILPEGTRKEIHAQVMSSNKLPTLPGHPDRMTARECATWLVREILVSAHSKVKTRTCLSNGNLLHSLHDMYNEEQMKPHPSPICLIIARVLPRVWPLKGN